MQDWLAFPLTCKFYFWCGFFLCLGGYPLSKEWTSGVREWKEGIAKMWQKKKRWRTYLGGTINEIDMQTKKTQHLMEVDEAE